MLNVIYDLKESIIRTVKTSPGIKLNQLLECFPPDDLFSLIATNEIHVNLEIAPLAEPERVSVFADPDTAKAYELVAKTESVHYDTNDIKVEIGSCLTWNNDLLKIVNIGENKISMTNESGQVIELSKEHMIALAKEGSIKGVKTNDDDAQTDPAIVRILEAGPKDLQAANYKFSEMNSIDGSIPERTIRSWRKKYNDAEMACGNGYVGLISKDNEKGNRSRKISPAAIEMMRHNIDTVFESPKQKSKREAYGELVNACEKEGIVPPCYKTYAKEIELRSKEVLILKRRGTRAAYQSSHFSDFDNQRTPRHGDRSFEIAHIDHTQLDIELIEHSTGKNLGRPWLTLMVDAYSRCILAFSLSFDQPSVKSLMEVFRECVKRYARLPQIVVTDNGQEFRSVYLDTFFARYRITHKFRPPHEGRFGSVGERLFRTINTQLIHQLTGNTQIMKDVRQVTKSVNPKNLASWSLESLNDAICEWAYKVYPSIPHSSLGVSPEEAFAASIKKTGSRPMTLIPYDREFRIYTMPAVERGTCKVQPCRGIKYKNVYYWSRSFQDPEVEGTKVLVRYDPYDIGIVYAFVKSHWVECHSEHYHVLQGRSRKLIEIATEEIKKSATVHGQQFTITAKKLAAFITSVESENLLALQRAKDLAYKLSKDDDDLESSPILIESDVLFNNEDDDMYDQDDVLIVEGGF